MPPIRWYVITSDYGVEHIAETLGGAIRWADPINLTMPTRIEAGLYRTYRGFIATHPTALEKFPHFFTEDEKPLTRNYTDEEFVVLKNPN